MTISEAQLRKSLALPCVCHLYETGERCDCGCSPCEACETAALVREAARVGGTVTVDLADDDED